MKRPFSLVMLSLIALASTVSCQRSSDEVWNDTQSAGRHVSRGVKTLAGFHGESRQIGSRDEFSEGDVQPGTAPRDYVGFDDDPNLGMRVGEGEPLQPRETPGEDGSSIPGIEAFKDPALDPELAETFRNVQFEYNSSLIKGEENLGIIAAVADWLKTHPNTYIFVEGHCDNRGPAAYNFALGANRSNAVRNLLIKEGVVYDHVFTISYGKERPLIEGDGEEIWRVNRRGQFKVYEKN